MKMASDSAEVNDSNKTCEDPVASPTAEKLAAGLLEIYQAALEKVKMSLHELLVKQIRIYENLSVQNAVILQSNVSDVGLMAERAKIYKEKLIAIKRQMIIIHNRTQSLKKRALRVQTCREKITASVAQKRMQEEALIGKASSEQGN